MSGKKRASTTLAPSGMNQTYISKTKIHLATRVREHPSRNSAIFYLYLPATHVIILLLRILIFFHTVTMILKIK